MCQLFKKKILRSWLMITKWNRFQINEGGFIDVFKHLKNILENIYMTSGLKNALYVYISQYKKSKGNVDITS